MNTDDTARFQAVIAGLCRMFGGAVDQVLLDAYWMALSDWPLEEFEAAARQLMKTATFMPKPAEFNALRKAGDMTAGEAFEKARQIVRRLNPREMISHQSGDARLDATIRACGGYEALAMCETDNIGFFERRFAEHYETITDAEVTRASLPQITGGPKLGGPWKLADIMKSLEHDDERP